MRKPLTDNLDEANEVTHMLEKSNRIGMVGYIYRFSPIFEHGHSLLTGGVKDDESVVLGKITTALFRLGGRGSHQLWKHRCKHGGGAINEMLVHMVDLAIWYFGPVGEVRVLAHDLLRPQREIQGVIHDVDAEDYVIVRLTMENGVDVLCLADMVTPAFTQFIEVQGERGTFFGSIQPQMPSFLYLEQDSLGFRREEMS